MNLLRIAPVPRCLTLGGRDFLVSELRLIDVATLQAWVVGHFPYPTDLVPQRETVGEEEWRERLRRAYEYGESWPLPFGSPASSRMLTTPDGVTFFLRLVLSRNQPDITDEECRLIADAITPAEWKHLGRIVYGSDPLDAIEDLMELPRGLGSGAPMDWEEVTYEVASAMGLHPNAVLEMTLSQFSWAARRGKKREHGLPIDDTMSQEQVEALMAERRRIFYGDEACPADSTSTPTNS